MINTAATAPRPKLLGYWWAPVMVLAVALAVMAFLQPYQAIGLSELAPQVVESASELDKALGAPVKGAFKYSIRRSYLSPTGPMEVEIRVTLQPIGHGLVMREDEWYEIKGRNVVYQERFILFRNLFALHTRSRERAPFVHDVMGRIGWYTDSVQSFKSKLEGATPESPSWQLNVTTDRMSNIDGKGLLQQSTPYQRDLHCEYSGELAGPEVGAAFKGSYPKISCRSSASNQPAERRSEYAYLPEHGIFLLLSYQQQTGPSAEKLAVNGNYVSFEALP